MLAVIPIFQILIKQWQNQLILKEARIGYEDKGQSSVIKCVCLKTDLYLLVVCVGKIYNLSYD